MYFVARLAQQGMKLHGLKCWFIYLAARLALRGIKEQRIIDMRVTANEPNGPARLVRGLKLFRIL